MEEQPQTKAVEKEGVSDAPTVPVRRRLAWDAENHSEDSQKQPKEMKQEEEGEKVKEACPAEPEKWEVPEKYKTDKIKEGWGFYIEALLYTIDKPSQRRVMFTFSFIKSKVLSKLSRFCIDIKK